MIASILKALPALATIVSALGSVFKFFINLMKSKKQRELKKELSEAVDDVKNATTDQEVSDAVKRINGM